MPLANNIIVEFNCPINQLPSWLEKTIINHKKYSVSKVVIITDQQIFSSLDKLIDKEFLANFTIITLVKPVASVEFANSTLEEYKNLRENIWQNCQLLISIGSGTITDLTKYLASQINIDFLAVPSATSMNGYLSATASLTENEHKKSLKCRQAVAVFADLELIYMAPTPLNLAGIADSLAFYSCCFDWLLSHYIFNRQINILALNIINNSLNDFLDNYQKYSISSKELLKKLLLVLLEMGIAMNIDQSSNPASQSEHLIAHSLTMHKPRLLEKLYHGQQIAFTLPISLALQQQLLKAKSLQPLNLQYPIQEIIKNFGAKIEQEANKEFSEKMQIIKNNQKEERWQDFLKEINSKYAFFQRSDSEIIAILDHFNIGHDIYQLEISKSELRTIINLARFLRNRITCLDFINFNN
jgi:glycerol-1-phosphate dehydrogenase [NAD(P)+]